MWCFDFVNRKRPIRKKNRSSRSSRSRRRRNSLAVSGAGGHAILPDTARIFGLFQYRGIETTRVFPCWLQNTFVLITSFYNSTSWFTIIFVTRLRFTFQIKFAIRRRTFEITISLKVDRNFRKSNWFTWNQRTHSTLCNVKNLFTSSSKLAKSC